MNEIATPLKATVDVCQGASQAAPRLNLFRRLLTRSGFLNQTAAGVLTVVAGLLPISEAQASDYGCKVLLCLANPAGPTAAAQCVPPITQLWRDLARMRPFPVCDEARPALAVPTTSWYDPCPGGTTALGVGILAYQLGEEGDAPVQGIGEGVGVEPDPQSGSMLSRKVCVGNQVGQVQVQTASGEDSSFQIVNVYDRVAIFDPASSPNVVDVYVDNALYRRVRW